MWEALLASAAANKAAALGVGLSVLLGSAGAAEVTGIGPSVRDIVHDAVVPASSTQELEAEGTPEATPTPEATVLALVEEDEDALDAADDQEHNVLAADDAPGNLVWHQKDGAFHLRGLLVEGVMVRTAGPDGEPIDLLIDPEATFQVPGGKPSADDDGPLLEDYVGYLVQASGVCSEPAPTSEASIEDESQAIELEGESQEIESESVELEAIQVAINSDCTVTELRVLGNAGRPGTDDDLAPVDEESSQSAANEDGDDGESVEATPSADDPDTDGHGKPDHAGGPKPKDDTLG